MSIVMYITKATNITSIILQEEIICIINIHIQQKQQKKKIEKYRIFLFYNPQIIYKEKKI